jgi:hypothetical protein
MERVGEMRNVYNILVSSADCTRAKGWENNISMNLKRVGYGNMNLA